MCDCSSISCELEKLTDEDTVTIEFADSNGNTLFLQEASPRVAEEVIYRWCLENLPQ